MNIYTYIHTQTYLHLRIGPSMAATGIYVHMFVYTTLWPLYMYIHDPVALIYVYIHDPVALIYVYIHDPVALTHVHIDDPVALTYVYTYTTRWPLSSTQAAL